jgi:hypothetical protein
MHLLELVMGGKLLRERRKAFAEVEQCFDSEFLGSGGEHLDDLSETRR